MKEKVKEQMQNIIGNKIAINAIIGIVLYLLMFSGLSPRTDNFTFSITNFFAAIFLVKAIFLKFPHMLTGLWAVRIDRYNLYIGVFALLASVLPAQVEYARQHEVSVERRIDWAVQRVDKNLDRLDTIVCIRGETDLGQEIEDWMSESNYDWRDDLHEDSEFLELLEEKWTSENDRLCFWTNHLSYYYQIYVRNSDTSVSPTRQHAFDKIFAKMAELAKIVNTTGFKQLKLLEQIKEKINWIITQKNTASPTWFAFLEFLKSFIIPLSPLLLGICAAVKIAQMSVLAKLNSEAIRSNDSVEQTSQKLGDSR